MPKLRPTFITENKGFFDYRPAMAEDGETVLFERTVPGYATVLYQATDLDEATVKPFLPDLAGAQTRPAINWADGRVAFNGDNQIVHIVKGDGTGLTTLKNTQGMDYPQWTVDGKSLAVENVRTGGVCSFPVNSLIDISTAKPTTGNMNGTLAGNPNVSMFGGMPGLNPVNTGQFATATQPQVQSWPKGTSPNPCGYNQMANQIFLGDTHATLPTMTPMEPGASGEAYDATFQGRAPSFSPDGKWVVFESNRHNNSYALYLFKLGADAPAVRLTKSKFGAQHAKFFPCGTRLIFVAAGANSGKKGIAWIDIAPYVSQVCSQ